MIRLKVNQILWMVLLFPLMVFSLPGESLTCRVVKKSGRYLNLDKGQQEGLRLGMRGMVYSPESKVGEGIITDLHQGYAQFYIDTVETDFDIHRVKYVTFPLGPQVKKTEQEHLNKIFKRFKLTSADKIYYFAKKPLDDWLYIRLIGPKKIKSGKFNRFIIQLRPRDYDRWAHKFRLSAKVIPSPAIEIALFTSFPFYKLGQKVAYGGYEVFLGRHVPGQWLWFKQPYSQSELDKFGQQLFDKFILSLADQVAGCSFSFLSAVNVRDEKEQRKRIQQLLNQSKFKRERLPLPEPSCPYFTGADIVFEAAWYEFSGTTSMTFLIKVNQRAQLDKGKLNGTRPYYYLIEIPVTMGKVVQKPEGKVIVAQPDPILGQWRRSSDGKIYRFRQKGGVINGGLDDQGSFLSFIKISKTGNKYQGELALSFSEYQKKEIRRICPRLKLASKQYGKIELSLSADGSYLDGRFQRFSVNTRSCRLHPHWVSISFKKMKN